MGKPANLKKPNTFNEKIQFLKLYDKNPLYTQLADKVLVKNYVINKIGTKYIIPTLGIWKSSNQIDLSSLPSKFALKCNHDSGTVFIIKNKNNTDFSNIYKKLDTALKKNFFFKGREWAYKNISPSIIAEELLEADNSNLELDDYKFYCFNGTVDSVMICKQRQTGNPKFYFFDKNWRFLKYNKENSELPTNFTLERPQNFDEMIKLAEKLSENLRFVRVDLYNINGRIYFGEYTFYPDNGYDSTLTTECEQHYGNQIDIIDLMPQKGKSL